MTTIEFSNKAQTIANTAADNIVEAMMKSRNGSLNAAALKAEMKNEVKQSFETAFKDYADIVQQLILSQQITAVPALVAGNIPVTGTVEVTTALL